MRHRMRIQGTALAIGLLAGAGCWGTAQAPLPPASQTPGTQPAGNQTGTPTGNQTTGDPAQAPAPSQPAPTGQFPAPGQVMPELHVEPVRRPGALPEETRPASRPDALPAADTGSQPAPQLQQRERYRIHEGDQILVEFTYTPEFNQTVTVQPDGFVTLRVGGDLKFAGHTLDEVKAMVEQSASARLKDPVVALALTDFQHPYFVVAGEAFAPLKYELRERLTVLQGLMLAGGIRQTGKEKQVVLIHGLGSGDQQVSLLDLKHVESNKIFEHDMDLASGDIIFIPRNKLTRAIQVMQLVNSPAGYANTAAYAFR